MVEAMATSEAVSWLNITWTFLASNWWWTWLLIVPYSVLSVWMLAWSFWLHGMKVSEVIFDSAFSFVMLIVLGPVISAFAFSTWFIAKGWITLEPVFKPVFLGICRAFTSLWPKEW